MSNNLQLAIELTARTDRLTGGLARGQQAVKGFTQGVQREFAALGRFVSSVEGKLAGLGIGVGLGVGLSHAARAAAEAEHSLRAMGNAGNLSREQLAGMADELLDTSLRVNQSRQALIAGMDVMVAAGMDFGRAKSLIHDVGFAATGTGADIADLAQTVYTLDQNLKVLPKDMGYALDVLATAGYQGSFELKNMARYFPVITAQVQKLHMEGPKAAASLGAALQIAKHGAGTNEEAATNLSNFLQKLTSPETLKNFEKKFGVDWNRVFTQSIQNADDPLLATVKYIRGTVGTDPFKLGELFGDMQVTNFLNPMMRELEEYQKIRDRSLAGNDAVAQSFRNMMDTMTEQWKRGGLMLDAIVQKSETVRKALDVGGKRLKEVNDYLGGGADGPVSLEKLAGMGVAGTAGAYALSRILPPALGKLLGKPASLAGGVASGKALEAATGVQPVFVTNWPDGGAGGGGGLSSLATGAAAGALLPKLFSTWRTGAALLAGSNLSALPLYGAGAVGTAALGVGAAGAAGYGAGSLIYKGIEGTQFADSLGRTIARALASLGNDTARGALAAERAGRERSTATDAAAALRGALPITGNLDPDRIGTGIGESASRVLALAGSEESRRALELSTRLNSAGEAFASRLNAIDLGGHISIRIDSAAPARVTSLQANSPGMQLSVDTGPAMVLPQ